jgi:hypothetical protein
MPGEAFSSVAELLATYLARLIFGLWFLASIFNQFHFRWWERIVWHDAFSLIPRWTFFAPNPGRHDYHVVFREWAEDDDPGEWIELSVDEVDLSRRWLWNPSRYPNKGIADLTAALARIVNLRRDEPLAVTLSSPYISLLHVVMAQSSGVSDGDRRQFAIVKTSGFGEKRDLDIAFVSEVHRRGA